MAITILFGIYVELMLPVTETVFWIALIIVVYTYTGYPLLLVLLVTLKRLIARAKKAPPTVMQPVTLIVAAYNEEDIIVQKIENCFSLDYPRELLYLIFITDGSTDATSSIVDHYPGILHLHQPVREGKLAAINRAMTSVTTEVVIFTDANTMLNAQSVQFIMSHYDDAKVGGVAGEKKVYGGSSGGTAKGEGAYWKYESLIKKFDSRLYTVVGAAGELFSMRTSLYTHLPKNIIIEDFVQSLSVCLKLHVVRYEPRAYAVETASGSLSDEMERKIRISAGGFQAICYLKRLLNVFRHPVTCFQYISHRVLRWTLTPVALLVLFTTSAMLADAGIACYAWLTWLQAAFYTMAVIGWAKARVNRHSGLLYVPFYFVFMNFCVFAGFFRFISGKQDVKWKKAARNREK